MPLQFYYEFYEFSAKNLPLKIFNTLPWFYYQKKNVETITYQLLNSQSVSKFLRILDS